MNGQNEDSQSFGVLGASMKLMIVSSLLLNIAVLIPVCGGLITGAVWTQSTYGGSTAASRILLAVYLSILICSVFLLFVSKPEYVVTLLFLQVIYKIITPLTIRTFGNPVVVSNIFIALFHCATLAMIWRGSLSQAG